MRGGYLAERIKRPGRFVRAFEVVLEGAVRYAYLITSRVTVAFCVLPPPVAVMVMVWFPVVERLPTFTVMVEVPDPGAAMVLGLKVMVWPLPCPDADRVTAELNPPETVVVMLRFRMNCGLP